MHLVLTSAPGSEPLDLATVKAHLNVTSSTWNTQLTTLITVVRKAVERYLKRALITQTWTVYYDRLHEEMALPYPPLQSVTSIKYRDLNGTLQTINTNNYFVDLEGYVKRGYDVTYPETQYGRPNSVQIEYIVGYGDDASDVPEDIVHGMLIWITDLWENRGEIVTSASVQRIPNHISGLLHDYRIYNFAC